nr:hypothetical protein [Rhodoferax sp.]
MCIHTGTPAGGRATHRIKTASGDKLHLTAGDPIVETVNTVHYGVNDGKVPAEIIVVYAGAVDQAITVVEPK